jgi:DNA adenine methylase
MRHHEPFLGGAAMFFARRPRSALLSDKNPHLCATYVAVRDDVEAVIAQLRELRDQHSTSNYYALRHRYNHASLTPVERAALFIYLNKTGYNGLYRVNRRGEFNVPVGRYTTPRILDEQGLRVASRELRSAELRCADFEDVLEQAQAGDFVYLDPPYVPVSPTSRFTAYAAGGFTLEDQKRLRDVFVRLSRRGCAVMLSNSATPAVRELYAGYRFDVVAAVRSINCAASNRGAVSEFVVRNYNGVWQAELVGHVDAAEEPCDRLERVRLEACA